MSAPENPAGVGPRTAPARPLPPHRIYRPEPPPGELNGKFLAGTDDNDAQELARLHRRARRRLGPGTLRLQAAQPAAHSELILDTNNLLPFHFLREGDRVGRAVVKIERADRAAGTGFLVAPDILLTNHHVLPDAAIAAGAVALANLEASPPGERAARPTAVSLEPGRLFVTSPELDFTFCAVGGLEHLGSVPLSRDSLGVVASECVNIIQHPRGRPKEVALQDNQVVKADHVVVQYSCDTEPGSSGSPVFNNRWTLVALHHASVETDHPGGRSAVDGAAGAHYLNEGVRLSAIALWLESAEANAPERRAQVARLRTIFGGIDPQAGFFGALGARLDGRTAVEFVVEAYRGGGDHLDIGFWDLAPPHPDRPFRDRLADLGWAMADMRMDVWCLANAGPDDARALCHYLETNFRLEYDRLTLDDAARPAAVLYRRSRTLGVTRDQPEPPAEGFEVLRVEASNCKGQTATVQVVPVGPGADAPTGPPLGALIAGLDRQGGAADWVLIGDALRLEPSLLSSLADTRFEVVAASEGTDGAIALLGVGPGPTDGEDRPPQVERVFVGPNQVPRVDAGGRLVVVDDRELPVCVEALGGRRPVAVRLVLDPSAPLRTAPAPAVEAASPPSPAPAPAESQGGLVAIDKDELERLLRDLLAPVVARLVAEARAGDGG